MSRARQILADRGLAAFADRPLSALSGGERQRVRLAALVAQEARLWLLDEPANHLDPAARIALMEELGRAVREGHGAVLVTHEVAVLAHLRGVPTRVVGLSAGAGRFELDAQAPELEEAIGSLLGLRLAWMDAAGARRLVVLGAR